MNPFYHIGIIVEDIEAAMEELTRLLGVRWEKVYSREEGPWHFKVTYSIEGPPHIELTEGRPEPGHPFDTSQGARIDHIGYWCEDFPGEKKRLNDAGLALELDNAMIDGRAPNADPPDVTGFSMHRTKASGLRIQLQDIRYLPRLKKRLGTE